MDAPTKQELEDPVTCRSKAEAPHEGHDRARERRGLPLADALLGDPTLTPEDEAAGLCLATGREMSADFTPWRKFAEGALTSSSSAWPRTRRWCRAIEGCGRRLRLVVSTVVEGSGTRTNSRQRQFRDWSDFSRGHRAACRLALALAVFPVRRNEILDARW